jgi:hypothetical protein
MNIRPLVKYKQENPEKYAVFLQGVEFENNAVSPKGIENEIYIYIAFDMLGAEFIALNRGFFWYKNKRNNKVICTEIGRLLLYAEHMRTVNFGLSVVKRVIERHAEIIKANRKPTRARFLGLVKEIKKEFGYYMRFPIEVNALILNL